MTAAGRAFKYGDNVDTDAIIPARYLNTSDPAELAAHCMEDLDPSFAGAVRPGDVLVGGRNFGCGSSREHAPVAIKAAGVSCVIAASFARIFYRNAVNIGLPILESPEAAAGIEAGDRLSLDFGSGTISDGTKNSSWRSAPFPPFMRRIMEAGGLTEYVRARLTEAGDSGAEGGGS
ncbi:MAG TPA: 3-isopropylmalate dehydratase small subunit [Spirochaetia bacterium]|nr:3-isopropylmalate dehydratase small subunit [Spirochaetales bacterium]HRY79971.1 3-isopropylmalate dehydratase small subunit [Spirochaetia bacterium]HRZ87895.1 3-isopropylmalate dehydratase small subunit [Spirochaetia bacterium]